jgi:hypothetical protein
MEQGWEPMEDKQFPMGFPCEIFPESDTEFFFTAVDVDAQLSFVTNSAGMVKEAILHQNGKCRKAKKVQ